MSGTATISIQERDLELLRGLYESRLMTLAHAAALHFDGKAEAAKKRVQRLKAAGLIRERPRRPYEPSVLFLTRLGFLTLDSRGLLTTYPQLRALGFEKRAHVKDLTLRHELQVMDVKAAITTSVRTSGEFEIAEFSTWPALHAFRVEQPTNTVTVKPDGFIRIREHTNRTDVYEHSFFLEVDRSTETQETLALKARCYRDYYRSGGFALKHGRSRQDFESFPFRVLMIFQNTERRNNVAERLLLLVPPILTQVWLSTFSEVLSNPLNNVWVQPADYRRANANMVFDPSQRQKQRWYTRSAAREAFIEEHIQKCALLPAG